VIDWLGTLHPILLHYPYGLLAALVVVEWVAWRRAEGVPRPLRIALYALLALSGIAAGGTGWLLGHAGVETATIERHERWGIGLAVGLLVLLWHAWKRPQAGRARVALLALICLVSVGAGHIGGTLTHGRGFVGAGAPAWFASPAQVLDRVLLPEPEAADADLPGGEIYAIFERNCVECHGPDKQKGKLRLDTRDGLESVVDRSLPLDSELLYRIALPATHEDVMPPEDPLAAEDIAVLLGWVLAGAPMEEVAADQAAASETRESEAELLARLEDETGARILAATGYDPVYAAERLDAFVAGAGGTPLTVDFSLGAGVVDAAMLGALLPLRERVAELSLAGRSLALGDAPLPGFPYLARLHVERTGASVGELRMLLGATPALAYLNLHGTGADDALLADLQERDALRRLVLHDTEVSADALAAFRAARPEIDVTGDLTLPVPADRDRRVLIADAGKGVVVLLREKAIGDYEVVWEQPYAQVHALLRTRLGIVLLESPQVAMRLDPATGEALEEVEPPSGGEHARGNLDLRPSDVPGMTLGTLTVVEELPGGTYLVAQSGAGPAEPQLFEVDRDKEVLWTFRDHQRFSDRIVAAAVWEGPAGGE